MLLKLVNLVRVIVIVSAIPVFLVTTNTRLVINSSSLYQSGFEKYQIERVTGIPKKALMEVVRKGKGAYYSSGSRPNQTAESWGRARMYSYIMGGPTRKVDNHITNKYNVRFHD